MNEKRNKEFPYKPLGDRLKRMREKAQESLAEVSGAVEVDVAVLSEIERGVKRPTEDILLLLLSHFSVKDDEAVKLWEMAGYTQRSSSHEPTEPSDTAQQVFVLPMDARVVYTDMFRVTANQYGVVMNFLQTAGPNGKPLAISRIGMSREQAQEVLADLRKSLEPEQPKALPAPDQDTDKKHIDKKQ